MASLEVRDKRVEVVMSGLERLGALRGDVSVSLDEVLDVRPAPEPFTELCGWRLPGTGIPRVIALGTWRSRDGKDFAAVYRGRPAVVVEVRPGGEFRRLIVAAVDAESTVSRLRTAVLAR
ncbi:hypothetical protein [Candidatus Frankia alpina]|uniref:Uncharacterized protein n=1 Tax=Candidatus Frankia alpina TaxID=2699483 RepID=A0A4S5ER29_9ACTN|nr:hypothetical protein [Candidatus Frankia alpina]THJ74885.1 hypothetical protein E7Y31_08740 [Candidatus Frankia alpina]